MIVLGISVGVLAFILASWGRICIYYEMTEPSQIVIIRRIFMRVFHFSMAVALATTGTLALTALAQEAQAAKNDSGVKISKEVRPKVTAIQTLMASGTPSSAKPLVEALLAETLGPDDRFVAGQLAIQLGSKINDPALQEKGIIASLDSGRTGAEQLPAFNFFAGNFAYGAERWADAAQYFQAAYDLGYRANNIEPLLAETYFKRGMHSDGLAKWNEILNNANASPTKAPESWYRLARDRALGSGNMALYSAWATKWASAYPSEDSRADAAAGLRDAAAASRLNADANVQPKGSSGITDAKKKCADLGFERGTPAFGQCVLKVSE